MREGTQFGAYLLEERLAVGGMAEVFRARRVGAAGFARPVCVKRMLPALCAEPSFVEMFVDEARTGAQLRHGNIVAIEDFGEVGGQYYLCMELVTGVDLQRLAAALHADGRVFPADVVSLIALEVARALDYAHRKVSADGAPLAIVHRDVSPHNVLASYAGEVKLTDFGIAKAASRLHHTVGQVIKGKLAYMAPEQAGAQPLDGRADLFALGVTLFELLCGRRPFQGATEGALVLALLRGDRSRLRAVRPDVPDALDALIEALLATERTDRPASAGEVAERASALGAGIAARRTLAAMVSHYFPGEPSAGRAVEFTPDALPALPPGAAATRAESADDRALDTAPDAPPTAPARATPRRHADATALSAPPTFAASATPGDATVVSTPVLLREEAPGLPATAVHTALAPRPSPAPLSHAPRETSPEARTRTIAAPLHRSHAAPPAPIALPPGAPRAVTPAAAVALVALAAALAGGLVFVALRRPAAVTLPRSATTAPP